MIKAVIYLSELEALGLVEEIDNLFRPFFQGATNGFSSVIKHPTEDKWAVMIKMKQVNQMLEQQPLLMSSLSKGVADLVDLDSSWINNVEI